MNCIFETDIVVVPVRQEETIASLEEGKDSTVKLKTDRFSKKVFALIIFFPMALAFHAQNDPDGST